MDGEALYQLNQTIMNSQTILLTGSAGFIGFHLANQLAKAGHRVVGIDNLNDYYDPKLKLDRLVAAGFLANEVAGPNECNSTIYPALSFQAIDLKNTEALAALFDQYQFNVVVNLAAQAG